MPIPKDKKVYNDGKTNKYFFDCDVPEGYIIGKLPLKKKEKHKICTGCGKEFLTTNASKK